MLEDQLIKTPTSLKLEHYRLVRDQIQHEANLINQRINWALLVEGFTVAAFASLQGLLFSKDNFPGSIFIILCGLCSVMLFLGARFMAAVTKNVALGFEHEAHLREWWWTTYPEERRDKRTFSNPPWYLLFSRRKWWLSGSTFRIEPNIQSKGLSSSLAPSVTPATEFPPIAGFFAVDNSNSISGMIEWFVWLDLLLGMIPIIQIGFRHLL